MALKKIKLGDYITQHNTRNFRNLIKNVKGISVKKEFREPTSKVDRSELKNYKLVLPGYFASVQTTHNEKCFAFAYNDTGETIVVSSVNLVFSVDESVINPRWLQVFFNRSEFDRYTRFNSWGSAREIFTWEDLCNIEIDLPDLGIQEKFVKIYLSMVENQKAYEKGLNDLKLVCDGYIENLRKQVPCEEIRAYINEKKDINKDYKVKRLYGLTNELGFQKPSSMSDGVDIGRYKCISKDDIVYPPPHFGEIGTIGLFRYDEGIVSPMYVVFEVNYKEKLNPDYLFMWLKRQEFMRYAFFASCDSIRDTFDFEKMCEYKIPIPSIDVQKSIASLYNCCVERKLINEKLKQQIKDICPILIKGSLAEAM